MNSAYEAVGTPEEEHAHTGASFTRSEVRQAQGGATTSKMTTPTKTSTAFNRWPLYCERVTPGNSHVQQEAGCSDVTSPGEQTGVTLATTLHQGWRRSRQKQACRTAVGGQTGSPLRFLDLTCSLPVSVGVAYSRRLSAILLTLSSRSAALR